MAFVMTGYCYLACWIFVDNPQALLKRSPHTTYLQSLTNLQWRSGFRGSWLIWVAWNCASRPLGSRNALALQHAPALVLHTKAVHVLLSSPPQLPGKCSGMDIAPRLTGFISRTFRLLSDCLALWNFQRWADLTVQRWLKHLSFAHLWKQGCFLAFGCGEELAAGLMLQPPEGHAGFREGIDESRRSHQ